MNNYGTKSTRLGDLVVAAFDEAGRSSADPLEVSRLAVETVARVLRRSHGQPALASGSVAFDAGVETAPADGHATG